MAPEVMVWLTVGLVGALVSLLNWVDAVVERELAGRDDPREDFYAWHAVRREALRHATLVLGLVAVVASLAGWPRPVVVWALVASYALVTVNSLADRYERLRARRGDWPPPADEVGQTGETGLD